jgi:hypothetical protein
VADSRRIWLRIFLTVVVGMAIAMGAVGLFVSAMGAGSQSLLGRVLQAQDAIPQIAAEDEDLVMVFGSSMVEAAFSPREFDRSIADAGGEVKSFNFGFGGLNPLFQDYVARRIAEDLKSSDRRLKLVLIEFNPFQTTKTRRQLAAALEEAYIALLASPAELWQILLDDPERGIRMLEIRYLRDGISAEATTTYFWAGPFQAPRAALASGIQEDEGVQEKLDEVLEQLGPKFEEEYPDYDGSDWYYPWQGGGTIKSERAADTLALFDQYYALTQTDYQMTIDRLNRIETADIEELDFDPELVEAFVRVVDNFKQVADHVEVIMLPKNTDWIKNSPEALARQADAVRRIEDATGVTVQNFQQIDAITIDMFSDTTHLNRYYGAVAFTAFLAENYADLLSQGSGQR